MAGKLNRGRAGECFVLAGRSVYRGTSVFHRRVIRLVVLMYVRFPLSLKNVKDLLFGRGFDIWNETVRLWKIRLGPIFVEKVPRKRGGRFRQIKPARGSLSVQAHFQNRLSLKRYLVDRRLTRNAAQLRWTDSTLGLHRYICRLHQRLTGVTGLG
jgi:transposase-like protein